ncbi:Reverse transcriptase (RNA-dependent DNA polymerase) [Rhizoctonia solani]|uniref:Reverse transcriptase (RNA-dependent DNA polymerase) n=1 Tax=Rhizoctonia solani TaxID=456999 RepID=A0A8H7I2K5_9AGAM|nr:Reverse transcriptase (RNA-dependent DNA polymerase) [Rhizoctonia solani]
MRSKVTSQPEPKPAVGILTLLTSPSNKNVAESGLNSPTTLQQTSPTPQACTPTAPTLILTHIPSPPTPPYSPPLPSVQACLPAGNPASDQTGHVLIQLAQQLIQLPQPIQIDFNQIGYHPGNAQGCGTQMGLLSWTWSHDQYKWLHAGPSPNLGVAGVIMGFLFSSVYDTYAAKLSAPNNHPTVAEALAGPDAEEWQKAMAKEVSTFKKMDTYNLTNLPPGHKAIGNAWVFTLKRNANGTPARYKGRLVAQGFSQQPGINFDEMFAPVVRLDLIRLLLSIANQNDWDI